MFNKKILISVLISYAAGVMLLSLSFWHSLVLLLSIIFLLNIFSKPECCILGIVVLVSSVIYDNMLPLIPCPGGSLHIPDVLIGLLLLGIVYKFIIQKKQLIATPLDKYFLVFYFWIIVISLLSRYCYMIDYHRIIEVIRILNYYLLFFAVTNLITTKNQIKFLLKGLIFIAVFIAVAMIFQAIVGDKIHFLSGRVETLETLDRLNQGVTRILPPGQTLLYVCLIIVLVQYIEMQGFVSFIMLFFLAAGMLLTFNRNYWLGIMLAVALIFFLIAREHRRRLYKILIAFIFTALILITSAYLIQGRPQKIVYSSIKRVASLFEGSKILQSKSLKYRDYEYRMALPLLRDHKLIGIGLGNEYRKKTYASDSLATYFHNGYLWMAIYLGIVGLILFLALLFKILFRGFIVWRSLGDSFYKATALGFTLSFLGMMFAAIVNPLFIQPFSIVVIVIFAGLIEVIAKTKS